MLEIIRNLFEAIRLSRKILLLAILLWLIAYALPPAQAQSSASCSPKPDFTIAASPDTPILDPGGSSISTISLTPVDGFTGIVNLTATNVPSDVLPPTFSPTSLDLSAGSTTSTLAIMVSPLIRPGDYFFDVNATSGNLFHFAKVTVRIPKMSLDIGATPNPLTIKRGSSDNATITLTSIFGFADTLNLTATIAASPPATTDLTLSLKPKTLILAIGETAKSNLTISTTTSTILGIYAVNITAIPRMGKISNSTTVVVIVVGPSFGIDAHPGQLVVPPNSSQTSTIEVTSILGFAGLVNLTFFDIAPFTPDIMAAVAPAGVALSSGSSSQSTVNISTMATVVPGKYTVSIEGNSSSLFNFTSIVVTVPGFSITSSPSEVTVPEGYLTTTTLTLESLNNFQDTVDLSVSCSPEGISAALSSRQASLSAGRGATSILTVSAASFTTPGAYIVVVEGIGESTFISNSTALVVTVTLPSFGFTMSAGLVTPAEILAGASGTSTITVTSVGGFRGLVNFSLSASAPAGLSCTVPASTTATGATTLMCKASVAGDYFVIVAGTAAIGPTQVSRITSVPFHVVDFAISASSVTPSAVLAGSSGTSTITVTALNGFDQTVTLSVSTPSAISCNLNHTMIQSSGTSILTCTGSSPGDYAVTVTASIGTVRHQTTVGVHVAPRPLQASILGLQPALFYGLIGGIVVLALVGGVAVALRRKNP